MLWATVCYGYLISQQTRFPLRRDELNQHKSILRNIEMISRERGAEIAPFIFYIFADRYSSLWLSGSGFGG